MRHIILLLLLIATFKSYSCECIGESTIKKSIDGADIVLTGTIISSGIERLVDSELVRLSHPDNSQAGNFPYVMRVSKYKIKVEQLFKGKIFSDTIIIYTGQGGGDCGYEFKIGSRYIIYGNRKTYFGEENNNYNFPKGRDIYWTNICKRTKTFDEKELKDIKTQTGTK